MPRMNYKGVEFCKKFYPSSVGKGSFSEGAINGHRFLRTVTDALTVEADSLC